MNKDKNLMRRSLDRKFNAINKIRTLLEKPLQGWVRTIRQALGLSSTQLAIKMGVTQARVAAIEKNEESLSITTLRRVAAAMGCRLYYILIPEEKLEISVKKAAAEKNQKIAKSIIHNMALENQEVALKELLENFSDD
jgi:Predicted transcriptional regulator with C-terminal CBS domains